MIDPEPTTPREPSKPKSRDQLAKNDETVKDLRPADSSNVKGGVTSPRDIETG